MKKMAGQDDSPFAQGMAQFEVSGVKWEEKMTIRCLWGRFLAEQRKKNHLTQQQLGDELGVTNKTVSRWENGNYMPDIEMMQIISKVLNVSINEILAGEILTEEQFRKQADENIVQISKAGVFSFDEKKKFWIGKWRNW